VTFAHHCNNANNPLRVLFSSGQELPVANRSPNPAVPQVRPLRPDAEAVEALLRLGILDVKERGIDRSSTKSQTASPLLPPNSSRRIATV
jgi:hypothetical protein